MQADIGLIGLAVMGQNLVLNIIDHGYHVAVYNRTISKVDEFLKRTNQGDLLIGAQTIDEFVNSLKTPRKIILMVKAGTPVDSFIKKILPYLDQGDILIDGGNSNYLDSNRRMKYLEEKGIWFLGVGISGGEEGARFGPSIMPGGSLHAWNAVEEIFQSISAKVEDNVPCCDWVGIGGAGHYVKMVHNGIEYGDMQLISEIYHLLRFGLGIEVDEISNIFDRWNQGRLNSYLIEITRDILKTKNGTNQDPLIDKILDSAGQKGTGKWTAISSLELGIPVTLIAEAVFTRFLSTLKEDRKVASNLLFGPNKIKFEKGKINLFVDELEHALYASKIISYAQGFMLMKAAGETFNWNLNYGNIALLWRGGCIIRSSFLGEIKKAYDNNPELSNLLLDSFFKKHLNKAQNSLRHIVTKAIEIGIPVPGLSAALSFYDGYRSKLLPANLIQAQRDYFGAHGYKRIDDPTGKLYHTIWKKNN